MARKAKKNATTRDLPKKVSPARRIQGQYIGLTRNLPTKQKARVRSVRAKQGVAAAIKFAWELRHSQ